MTVMRKCRIFFFLLLPVLSQGQNAPEKVSVQQYIQTYSAVAIKKMKEHHIPASITLAQGILESSNGNSDLALYANNHFGIKCHKEWTGETYFKDDDSVNECFRKYKNAEESFEDHSSFLLSRPRYSFLFELDVTDYKSWAYGLKKAGYATNPQYPERLIKIIEENKLYEYDQAQVLPYGIPLSLKKDSISERLHHPKAGKSNEFSSIKIGGHSRDIFRRNNIKYTLAQEGDNLNSLARDLDVMTWQLIRYNELKKNDPIKRGQIIYLQPKRRKGDQEFHIVKPGETLYDISQEYGIRLKQLYKKNRMEPGAKVSVGQKLWLRRMKSDNHR